MAEIDAHSRSVRQLLGGRKFTIDYFQREYRWGEKQIRELVTDLTSRFLSAWRPEHQREKAAKYPPYYLGSIIVSEEGGRGSVIDGQQRLTSLSLLLIWVLRGLTDDDDRKQVADLIFTRKYGSNDYNINVPERNAAMDALYKGEDPEALPRDSFPESVRNILDRYEDIDELMPEAIVGAARAHFADWLMERVFLVEIVAPSDDDGYEIFETMNDRGLALSPTDMLKSHLLANCGDDQTRQRLNEVWKTRINELLAVGKDEEADAIKAWLRARHAQSIREREAGALPQDFDRIGTEFHRWVRDNGQALGLTNPQAYARYVEGDFRFYSSWYLRLRRAANVYADASEAIYCNELAKFTLQYPLMLSPIVPSDSEDVAWRKALTVATFIDILIARRLWNGQSIGYSTMQYAMFQLMKAIRGKSADDVAEELKAYLEKEVRPFSRNPRFGLKEVNPKAMRRFLARLTTWLERQIDPATSFTAYLVSSGDHGYDIEHILADDHAAVADAFPSRDDFNDMRNRIGALLLLPRSFNRSYGGMSYEEKLPHYWGQNWLAKTLDSRAYQNNPGLKRVIDRHQIALAAHAEFTPEVLEARQRVYLQLAETIWSPDRLARVTGVVA